MSSLSRKNPIRAVIETLEKKKNAKGEILLSSELSSALIEWLRSIGEINEIQERSLDDIKAILADAKKHAQEKIT